MNSTQEKVHVKNGREAADKSVGEGPEKKKTKFDVKPRANEIIWTDLVEELKEGVRNQKKMGFLRILTIHLDFLTLGCQSSSHS